MNELKNFMMIFRFEPNNEYQPTPEEQAQQRQQWGAFIGQLAISEKLVSTHQLGFGGKQLKADLSTVEGVNIAEGYTVGGNMIVRANTIDEVIGIAKGCPILNMGGTVEVRDIMPM
ncbi:MAG: YciI family protein [Bacteroidota bacterium]